VSGGARVPVDEITRAAIERGRRHAEEILALRARALERRAEALARHPAPLELRGEPVSPEAMSLTERARSQSAGLLVAEGDSWFDYPLHDVLNELEDGHGYDVESVAHKGDPIEEMAYGGSQLGQFTRRIEKLLGRGLPPKAVLISGGGNDVAGDQFAMLLNHAASALAGLNAHVLQGVVDERVRMAYVTMLSAVTEVCTRKLGRPLPILVHGYDFPVPDGRGFLGGWWFLPGPWLEPGFREKGYADLGQRIQLARQLIERFNAMLAGIAGLPDFAHVHYIDLRNTLSTGPDYQEWWANELHPTERGFRRIADRFAAVLAGLP
jgi:lysophospholipase L1-like esterase